jgi:hypothetical protein
MMSEPRGGDTLLTGPLEDRAALFGVLAQIEALGLDLLEVRQVTAPSTSRDGRVSDGLWS